MNTFESAPLQGRIVLPESLTPAQQAKVRAFLDRLTAPPPYELEYYEVTVDGVVRERGVLPFVDQRRVN